MVCESMAECLNDGTLEVREAAFSVLAAVAKLVGTRPLEKSLDKLDEVRKKKLSEMIGISVSGAPTVAGSGGTSTEMEVLLESQQQACFVGRNLLQLLLRLKRRVPLRRLLLRKQLDQVKINKLNLMMLSQLR